MLEDENKLNGVEWYLYSPKQIRQRNVKAFIAFNLYNSEGYTKKP